MFTCHGFYSMACKQPDGSSLSRFTYIIRNVTSNYFLYILYTYVIHINYLMGIVLTILIQANSDFNLLLNEIFAFIR